MKHQTVPRLLTALFVAGLSCSVEAQTFKINLGYATATDYLPAYVAKENGCFAKNGLDITMTRMQIIGNIPPALIAGSLLIGIGTARVLLQAVDGGL